MKTFAIRIAAVVGFAILLIVTDGKFGLVGGLIWSIILSIDFAYVVMFVADAGVLFVVSAVTLLTIVFPLAVLLAIGYTVYHSLTETAAMLMASLSELPFQSVLQFVLPAVVVAGMARLFSHKAQAQRLKE